MRVFRLIGDNAVPVGSPAYLGMKLDLILHDVPEGIEEVRVVTLELLNGRVVQSVLPLGRLRSIILTDTSLDPDGPSNSRQRRKRRGEGRIIRGFLLRHQDCADTGCRAGISHLLPGKGRRVTALVMAHTIAHLALGHVRHSAGMQPRPAIYERVFYDAHDRRLIRIVFASTVPLLEPGDVSAYIGAALDYLDELVSNGNRPGKAAAGHLLEQLEALRRAMSERRAWQREARTT